MAALPCSASCIQSKILILCSCDDKTIWNSPFVPSLPVSQQVHPLSIFVHKNKAAHSDYILEISSDVESSKMQFESGVNADALRSVQQFSEFL